MVNSISELKKALGIKTLFVSWNDCISVNRLKGVYSDTDLFNSVCRLSETLEEDGIRIKVTRPDLYRLGLLAEMYNLNLSYFVIDEIHIELFFFPKAESTSDWLCMFKQYVTRRQFFNLVKSYKTIKQYKSMFEMSSYYQLTSPERPLHFSKPNVMLLDDDYILVQYHSDIFLPKYIIIKPGMKFETFKPEISYKENSFDCVVLDVEGKHFVGDSVRHLWNGVEKESNIIQVVENNKLYILNPETGILSIADNTDSEECVDFVLEKFRRDAHTRVIIDKRFFIGNDVKRAILLSNGCIWYVNENRFVNIKSIPGFENMNIELFSMSSADKGIILSLDENSIECVPCVVFESLLSKY